MKCCTVEHLSFTR